MQQRKGNSVTYNLREVEEANPELYHQLEMSYIALETTKKEYTVAVRSAAKAASKAQKLASEVEIATLEFLERAGEHFDLVNVEPVWLVNKERDGSVTLHCPMTQQDTNSIIAASAKQATDRAKKINNDDSNGMFAE